MKTLLAIGLVVLVYLFGFFDAWASPQRIAPMAPGVTHPGGAAKNAENPDVPHVGDDMVAVEGDGEIMVLVIPTSVKTEDDGSKSVVVVIMSREGSEKYGGARRLAGRVTFKCEDGTHLTGKGYVIGDEGDIVGELPADKAWVPTRDGTDAATIAELICDAPKLAPGQQEARKRRPNVTEL
jgi:hypothetical protein